MRDNDQVKMMVISSISDDPNRAPDMWPHRGVDIVPTTSDKNVYSVSDGEVTDVVTVAGYVPELNTTFANDRLVEIKCDDGNYYVYKCLDEIFVSKGDKVKLGDVIGTIGINYDLDATNGEHIHFENYFYGDDI